jgi:DNA polymerase I-like protein with 3'-5' exonuclease and polymerase domains
VLIKADLALVELCVAAELSGDEQMIRAITNQQDLHRLTAASTLQ